MTFGLIHVVALHLVLSAQFVHLPWIVLVVARIGRQNIGVQANGHTGRLLIHLASSSIARFVKLGLFFNLVFNHVLINQMSERERTRKKRGGNPNRPSQIARERAGLTSARDYPGAFAGRNSEGELIRVEGSRPDDSAEGSRPFRPPERPGPPPAPPGSERSSANLKKGSENHGLTSSQCHHRCAACPIWTRY